MVVLRVASSVNSHEVLLATGLGLGAKEEGRDLSHRENLIQLFREIRKPLFGYLVCIGLKPHEADDIVQEAFLRLHQQLESGVKIDEPRAWIFRVAHNASCNLQRARRRLVFQSDLDPIAVLKLEQRFDPGMNPETLYMNKEIMNRLDAGIERLTEPQRHCIYLRSQGLRYREIATVLGISVSSAAELLQRAVVRLSGEIHG
jgi:RNA polymerase sigma-70 factor, ECF subfamily